MEYTIDEHEWRELEGKTILIIGAASGIGRSTVEIAHEHGANIAIGDWNEIEGQLLKDKLAKRTLFRRCDVSKWDDVLDLFQATWDAFGRIDAVIANAGIHSEAQWLQDAIDAQPGKLTPPDVNTIRVNLEGCLYVTKCAMHYFSRVEARTQLVFTGSAASFLDTPPLAQYCASKAGILGLMRSLRHTLPKISNTTVNMVAPWHTDTSMTSEHLRRVWGDLPSNTTNGVGRALLLPTLRPSVNGRTLFVHGDQITDIETNADEAMAVLLGKELSKVVLEGQRRILG